MSEVKEVILLFQKADEMIVDYLGMIENMQRHIQVYLERNVPLPKGARIALNEPDNNEFLAQALIDLDDDKLVVSTHLRAIREELSNPSANAISNAKNLVTNWSLHIDRSMETVINQGYKESDVLPPPPNYWSPINKEFRRLFPFLTDDPRWKKKMEAVSNYLRLSKNPWAKYQK